MLSFQIFIIVTAVAALVQSFTNVRPRIAKSSALSANIVDTIAQSGNFKTLLSAIQAAGIGPALSGEGPFTIFAPTDEAFSKLPAGNMDSLMKDTPNLKNLLLFHVHPGRLNPTRNAKTFNSALIGGDKFPKQLTVKVTSWTMEVYIETGQPNHAKVITQGIKCDNGLIHVMDEVLIPYPGNEPPKVTFMGARDIEGQATLQRGYYGPIEGTDRNDKKYTGPDREFVPMFENVGDGWKEGGNWITKTGAEADAYFVHDGTKPYIKETDAF